MFKNCHTLYLLQLRFSNGANLNPRGHLSMPSNTFPLLGGGGGEVLLAFSACGLGVLLSTLQHTEQFLQLGVIFSYVNSPEFGEFYLAGGHIKK